MVDVANSVNEDLADALPGRLFGVVPASLVALFAGIVTVGYRYLHLANQTTPPSDSQAPARPDPDETPVTS